MNKQEKNTPSGEQLGSLLFSGDQEQCLFIMNDHLKEYPMSNQLFAREWKCRVAAKNSEAFIDYLYEVGVRNIASSPGFKGAQILRRITGEKMEITLITYWDLLSAIDPFTGQNIPVSLVCPEEEVFDLGPDLCVRHYEVLDHQYSPQLIR